MIVHLFPIAHNRSKRSWLVSASGGRQLRGVEGEALEDILAQWERDWGKITQLKKEKELSISEAEAKIEQMRKAHLEKRGEQ